MAETIVKVLVGIIVVVVAGAGATPPGIANNPSHASCNIKKYKHCYNLVHVCPKFCPDQCTVECASCKPICVGTANPPPSSPSTPQNPPPSTPSPPQNPPPSTPSTPQNPPPSSPSTPQNPPPSTPSPPENPPPSSPSTPQNPPPSTPSTPQNPPPSTQDNPPPSTPTTPSTPKNPLPSPSTPENPPPSTPSTPKNPPPSTPSTPQNPPPSSPTTPSTPQNSPPSSPTPPTPSPPENPPPSSSTPTPANPPPSSSTPSPTIPSPSTPPSTNPPPTLPRTATCRNKNYSKCYNMEHVCPNACPRGCEVDCVTCKPVCKCDRPGAVCQDPRFVGGDGITFYFHGKKDRNFCLVSDPNLHINGHFIGRRNNNMKRDFTWVQSIAILFHNHRLFVGALKTATWEDHIDRLQLILDGQPITLHQSEGATWTSSTVPKVSIVRTTSTNTVLVEVEGRLRVTAKVVPITEEDSRIHNYGITKEDCFAHLDLGFKFFTLSNEVSGVLGQTYKANYVSRVDVAANMPVMGGGKEFETTTLFSPDCSVSRFIGKNELTEGDSFII